MIDFIKWCNVNNGFLTAILSFFTLIISIITIVVSIRTARLPYLKRISLSTNVNCFLSVNRLTRESYHNWLGISVNAVNIGNRNVNILFLGLAIKCKDGTFKKLENINRELGGKGVILPAEIKTVNYTLDDLTILNNVDSKAVLYCFAIDSEGKKYKKKYGKVKGVVGSILKLKQ